MKSATINTLLSLVMASMAMATELAGDPTSATATVTVTEPVCMSDSDWSGQVTPLSIANAIATAGDASAAASLIASMLTDDKGGDAEAPQPAADTTTVTTVANATNCPAPPTFDLGPSGLFASLLNDDLASIAANSTSTNGTGDDAQHWSEGRNSMCFTTSNMVGTGYYAIYLDGWGQEHDGCGKGSLDNIRGQCGSVWYWGCRPMGSSVLLTFYLPGATRAKCALDGIWIASPKEKREWGLCCVYLGNSWLSFNDC